MDPDPYGTGVSFDTDPVHTKNYNDVKGAHFFSYEKGTLLGFKYGKKFSPVPVRFKRIDFFI